MSLAAKDYWSAFESSPEMVVCFVPSDAMLAAALGSDPALHEEAMARTRRPGRPRLPAGAAAHRRVHLAAGRPDGARPGGHAARSRPVRAAGHAGVAHHHGWAPHCSGRSRPTTRWWGPWSHGCWSRPGGCTRPEWSSSRSPGSGRSRQGPRPLTAMELIEAATAEDARPVSSRTPAGRTSEPGHGRHRATVPDRVDAVRHRPVSRGTGQCSEPASSKAASWRILSRQPSRALRSRRISLGSENSRLSSAAVTAGARPRSPARPG